MVKQNTPLLDSNAVLLVSGGAKGITAQCVKQIAEKAACRFILAGRSAILDPEPAWAQGLENSADLQKSALKFYKDEGKKVTPKALQKEIKNVLSSREIHATLQDIQAAGGKAVYVSADVTDEKALTKGVKAAVEEMGAVTGVIHGAGNLADKLIENKSARDFELVVNTKIKGLRNILQAVQPENLRFLVLFSSMAGFFGNAGQADYAMANEILNKSAHILDKSLPDCRVLSINWGPWDSGMVSPELKKVFKERNIHLIPADLGAQALIKELTRAEQPAAQILIGSPIHADLEFQPLQGEKFSVTRKLKLEDNPFLNDHRIGEQAVLPATCASAWLADTCASFHPGYSFSHMEDFKVLKGITFDGQGRSYQTELQLLPESNNQQKVYQVTVTSQNGTKRRTFHYSSQVTLLKEAPTQPRHELPQGLDAARNGSDFYADGTLFHGPSFQGIQEVLKLSEDTVITRVSLPHMDPNKQGQFPARVTNPYISDAIVQSLLLWTQEFLDAPCLPSRLHQWDQYQIVPFDTPVWVTLKITHANQHAVSGDILVQDEAGREYYHFSGLEGTVSKHLKRFIGRKEA